jgi:hypothetical protein
MRRGILLFGDMVASRLARSFLNRHLVWVGFVGRFRFGCVVDYHRRRKGRR